VIKKDFLVRGFCLVLVYARGEVYLGDELACLPDRVLRVLLPAAFQLNLVTLFSAAAHSQVCCLIEAKALRRVGLKYYLWV